MQVSSCLGKNRRCTRYRVDFSRDILGTVVGRDVDCSRVAIPDNRDVVGIVR